MQGDPPKTVSPMFDNQTQVWYYFCQTEKTLKLLILIPGIVIGLSFSAKIVLSNKEAKPGYGILG